MVFLVLLSIPAILSASPLWLRYPAISPDGEQVVFSYKGDLYAVSSSGGKAVPLTLNESHDFMPVFSPDGSRIAFASDRNGSFDIYVMPSSGGDAKRLTYYSTGDFPNGFSPDGSAILFTATRIDAQTSVQYPSGSLPELYSVSLDATRPVRILSTPAIGAKYDKTGNRIVYYDRKGPEDDWRKHHTSSIARDVWLYETRTGAHRKLTDFAGEDRNPVFAPDQNSIFYLSEQSGSFNVWQMDLQTGATTQITNHENHPVRFLTISDNADLCYTYNGEIYLLGSGDADERKLEIEIVSDREMAETKYVTPPGGITELALSPTGEELAFVMRGEIFVTSIEHGDTRRITDTPQQERSISFSPDARSILFAAERDTSWDVFSISISDDNEPYFFAATDFDEKKIAATAEEEFQPSYSPDGKEVAYLENRTTLKVIDLESGKTRIVLPGDLNYSYADGDQWYSWSPDGSHFLVEFIDRGRWSSEIGLVSAEGGEVTNLTNSGYEDFRPRWSLDGEVMVYLTDRYGMRTHGSWGSEDDVMLTFFTEESWYKHNLSESELAIWKKKEEKSKKKDDKDGDDEDKKDDDKDNDKDNDKDESAWFTPKELPDPVEYDLDQIENRTKRLTIHSSRMADALLTPDGEQLLYLVRFEKNYDLWSYKHRESEIKLLTKLGAKRISSFTLDDEGKNAYLVADGKLVKIEVGSGDKKPVSHSAKMYLDPAAEREYLFEHVWRQVREKFYKKDLHGVDWDFYKREYARFLPHITNNHDFADMLSEMLGELNASHTGAGYRSNVKGGDATAALGVFYDSEYDGPGLRIAEIIEKSPLSKPGTKISEGTVILEVDGIPIEERTNFYQLLNHKADKNVRLTFQSDGETFTEVVKPISLGTERGLLYERWIESRRAETERLSNGRLGYVHIRSMSDRSFRDVYSEILGRNADKEGLVVDTRFNSGGNLTNQLVTFLSGKVYASNVPRGQKVGEEPWDKWNRPSIVVMSEGNYSDAHYFPWAYRELGIGELVGMPVPGTATSVWWETLQDRSLYFGIPEVGIVDNRGNYLENAQLEPDYLVDNDPETVVEGRDRQLEKAVEVLLRQIDSQ